METPYLYGKLLRGSMLVWGRVEFRQCKSCNPNGFWLPTTLICFQYLDHLGYVPQFPMLSHEILTNCFLYLQTKFEHDSDVWASKTCMIIRELALLRSSSRRLLLETGSSQKKILSNESLKWPKKRKHTLSRSAQPKTPNLTPFT